MELMAGKLATKLARLSKKKPWLMVLILALAGLLALGLIYQTTYLAQIKTTTRSEAAGQCYEGYTKCQGVWVQTCTGERKWKNSRNCFEEGLKCKKVTSNKADCFPANLECTPGSSDMNCNGNWLQTCNSAGKWENSENCATQGMVCKRSQGSAECERVVAPSPKVACVGDCVSKTECTSFGGTIIPGLCTNSRVCCVDR